MARIDRRSFLLAASASATFSYPLAALARSARSLLPVTSPTPLTLHPDRPGARVPTNFIGLSYEVEQLSDPHFFSSENSGLVTHFRTLTPTGVLRLGGNTSDVGWWKPNGTAKQPPMNVRKVVGEPSADLSYAIEPQAIANLRGFLDSTGWTCIFGINLATNTPELAAEEAAFVAKTLGPKLEYFQLGNEPDLFKSHMRDPATWNADRYFDEWSSMAHAIRARVPEARFGLPDTSGAPEWYAKVVERLLALPPNTAPQIAALSHHYYFGGPPSNPDINIARLLQADPHVDRLAVGIREAARRLSEGFAGCAPTRNATTHDMQDQCKRSVDLVPYRMTEGNTCYRGGKPGVSDVFAAALWAADYALKLASLGYAGINLHGGGGKQVANSLGGNLPGEELMADRNLPHARPFYTPIADMGGHYTAQPIFKGLLFAQHFAGATMLQLDFDPGQVNATAYAAMLPTGQQILAIINKDQSKSLPLDLPGFALSLVLSAPSLTSARAELTEPASFREASNVPPYSAMLLQNTHGQPD